MEGSFLRSVAKAYVQSGELDSIFVLPNRRSMKFFQKYLGMEYGALHGKPMFSPKIETVNEFFTGLSGLALADSVEQLYILYKEYIAIKYSAEDFAQASKKETFDEFLHWGDTILKDFNDIDKYLVDARQLFSNIKDLKEIESDYSFMSPRQLEAVKCFWRNYLGGGTFSEKKEFFNSIWCIMHELYVRFNAALAQKGVGYEGQIYRKVAQEIDTHEFDRRVVFIGLNAPNKCERRVMGYLAQAGKGDFYWDFYGPMLKDPRNSAGEIISECIKEFPSRYTIEDTSVAPQEQKIRVYATPSGVGQAFVVADILDSLYPQGEVSQQDAFSTAVVLPDENLLMPVLNSIPEKFGAINVTMGYPIAATALASFMKLVQQLQSDVKERGGKWCFYHKSLLELLSHEYVKKLSMERAREISRKVVEGNMIYIRQGSEVLGEGDDILSLVFDVVRTQQEIAQYQMEILKVLDSNLESWDREFIYQYYLKVNSLCKLDIPMEASTWFKLVDRLCSGIVVPFKGEPLRGLQIMGTLETRALDFENVIIMSANEGKFPSSNTGQSVVPYNLRVGFGLPTYELQDGIAAYHFYRSICRAKNVYMVYDTRNDGLGSGEASRYVKQLKYHFGLDVQEVAVAAQGMTDSSKEPLQIAKDEAVMEQLMQFVGEGGKSLSASSLNNYIACPLKFYMETVEGMRDEDEVSESVESNVFGSIFHHVMEKIYSKYEGKLVTKDDLVKEEKDYEGIGKLILEGFAEYMHIEELSGQHKIIEALIRKYVSLALIEDMGLSPLRYVAGERRFRYSLPIYGGEMKVNFKAFIDRIDTLVEGNITRIADYKTGSVTAPGASFEIAQLFDKSGDGRFKAILQLYLYALIYFNDKLEKGEEIEDSILAIYPLKKIAKEHIMHLLLEHDNLITFRSLITECVEEIFNKDIPFYANPQEKHCSYCKLNALCGK